MEIESFNERCNRILRYLDKKASPYVEILSWDTFSKETGIEKSDTCISVLYEKKYINQTFSDISISDLGRAFIANYSFHQKRIEEETTTSSEWFNKQSNKVIW